MKKMFERHLKSKAPLIETGSNVLCQTCNKIVPTKNYTSPSSISMKYQEKKPFCEVCKHVLREINKNNNKINYPNE